MLQIVEKRLSGFFVDDQVLIKVAELFGEEAVRIVQVLKRHEEITDVDARALDMRVLRQELQKFGSFDLSPRKTLVHIAVEKLVNRNRTPWG